MVWQSGGGEGKIKVGVETHGLLIKKKLYGKFCWSRENSAGVCIKKDTRWFAKLTKSCYEGADTSFSRGYK